MTAAACCPAPPLAAPGAALTSAERRRLGTRLALAAIAAGLLVLSVVTALLVPGQQPVAELIAGIAAVLVAAPVFAEAWASLKSPSLHGLTDLLVAAAVVAALVVGDLESAALVPLAMVVGHVLEERSLIGSREAISALTGLTITTARRRAADGSVHELPAAALTVGDVVEVRPGDRIPADGVVREGSSSVDASSITGESVPQEVAPGDGVHAGTINLHGGIAVAVTRTGGDTTLGRVAALMRAAEAAKPPITRLLERFAGHYLVFVLLLASGTLFVTGSVDAMMAVLVASCPCALVLAAPATAVASLAVAGRLGVLVKGTAFLEELADVDALIIDKTGTLTLGELRLARLDVAVGEDPLGVRVLAASLAAASSHPVSRAVAALVAPAERVAVRDPQEVGGMGVSGQVDAGALLLGRPAFLAARGIVVPEPPLHDGPIVGLACAGRFLGFFLLADEPRAEAREALASLRTLGLTHQLLVTGDRRAVAERVAGQLGLDAVAAEVLPEQKLDRVLESVAAGRRPLVVGDGINDALALKAGAVGVAMGARGSDIALASADIVLMSGDLRRLATAVRLSRACRRTINVNVLIGLGWTAVVVLGAAAGLYGPVGAVVLHNVGTLAVMANAGRLLRFAERGQ